MNFIFDLYGTLIDIKTDEEKESFWRNLSVFLNQNEEDWGRLKTEYFELCASQRKPDSQEPDLENVFEEMLSYRGSAPMDGRTLARAFRRLSREKFQLFPYVKEMLQSLKTCGAGVYLLSNAQACFTRDELDETGLTPLFDEIILSSEVGWKKPSEKIFKIAFDRFSLRPQDCVYVGNDLRDDVLGANAVGMKTVYIPTEQSGRYENIALPAPDYTVENHEKLEEILFSLANFACA